MSSPIAFRQEVSHLYRLHAAELRARAASSLAEPSDAADVVQDAFVELLQRGKLPDQPLLFLRARVRGGCVERNRAR